MEWIVIILKIFSGALVFCTIYDILFKRGRNWDNRFIRPRYMGQRDYYNGSRVSIQATRIARMLEQDIQNKRTGLYDHNFNHEDHHKW